MIYKISQLIIAITVVLAVSAVAHSQEHEPVSPVNKESNLTVRLGDRVIAIPPPTGFEEASSQFPNIKTRFQASEPPENDLIGAYLPKAECEALRRGEAVVLTYYAKASVLRMARDSAFNDSQFAEMVSYLRANSETLMDPQGAKIKQVLQQLDKVYTKEKAQETKVALAEPKNLGVIDNRANVFTIMIAMTVNIDSGGTQSTIPMLAGITYLKIKEKVIFVFTYRKYNSQADLETLKNFTINWNNGILAAN